MPYQFKTSGKKLELPQEYNLSRNCKNLVLLRQDCDYMEAYIHIYICVGESMKWRILSKKFEEEHAKQIYDKAVKQKNIMEKDG